MPHRFRTLLSVALFVLVADQVSKGYAVSELTSALDGKAGWAKVSGFFSAQSVTSTERRTIIPGLAELHYAENPGAAWSVVMRSLPEGIRRPIVLLVSALALGFLFFLFLRLDPKHSAQANALAWVIGGAAGNFVDRIFRGYVIDFIELHWKTAGEGAIAGFRWPTFNLADVGIFVGLGLLLREVLRAGAAGQASGPGPRLPTPERV